MLRVLVLLMALATASQAQEMVIAPQYDGAGTFHAGMAPVKVGELWGFVDRTGKMIVAPQYANVRPGQDGVHLVQDEFQSWRALGPNVDDANWLSYRDMMSYKNGWASVWQRSGSEEKWFLIDLKGDRVSSTGFDQMIDWDPPFALVREAGSLYVIHVGEFGYVNAVEVPEFSAFRNATALTGLTGRHFIATSPQGHALLEIRFDDYRPEPMIAGSIWDQSTRQEARFSRLSPPSEGYVALQRQDGAWGFYHLATANFVWMGRFEQLRSFSEGYAAVKSNGKWGYINRRGEVVVQPVYDRAYDFHDGFAVIRQGELRGFMSIDPDRGITEFIAPQYQDVFRFREGLAPVKADGKWGFVSNGQAPAPELFQSGVQKLVPN